MVDPITRQTYHIASEIPCMADYTIVFQLDLEIDISWYQLSPDPMPFNKPLWLEPTELGHITQFPTFDTRRAGMYSPKQMKNFRENIIHASASDTVLKKLSIIDAFFFVDNFKDRREKREKRETFWLVSFW